MGQEWHEFQIALSKSEVLWEQENERLFERMREQPLPPIKIGDKYWGDYTPRIIK